VVRGHTQAAANEGDELRTRAPGSAVTLEELGLTADAHLGKHGDQIIDTGTVRPWCRGVEAVPERRRGRGRERMPCAGLNDDAMLGEPTFFPHATEAVWTLADDRSVYVVEHADGGGNSVVAIFLDDLDAHVAAVAARGLEPDERETYSNGLRKALYRDPDGNELGFGGAPRDTDPSA
jgi:hypothetical protein